MRPRGQILASVDPASLRPAGGDRVLLRSHLISASAFAPDRSQVAVGSLGRAEIRMVDLQRWRLEGEIEPSGGRDVEAAGVIHVSWPRPNRVIATIQYLGGRRTAFVVIEPQREDVVARAAVPRRFAPAAIDASADGVVALLRPKSGIGVARLAVVDSEGALRIRRMDRIPAGIRAPPPRQFGMGRLESPGLAVDGEAGVAYVVGAGARIAVVDLETLDVTYRPGTASSASPANVGGFARTAKHQSHLRSAAWLGCNALAIAGLDRSAVGPPRPVPTGLDLVDTDAWTERRLDDQVGAVTAIEQAAVSRRLPEGELYSGTAGFAAYAADGQRLFAVSAREGETSIGGSDGRVYLGGGSRVGKRAPVRVVELASGTTERRNTRLGKVLPPESGRYDEGATDGLLPWLP